jgi:cold shock CspA family protein
VWSCGREGKCVCWHAKKGWGVIEDTEGWKYFVGFNDILADRMTFRRLYDGQRVRFAAGPPGSKEKLGKAEEVEVIEDN